MKLKELVEKYGEYTVPQEFIDKLEKLKPQTAWDLTVGEEYYYAYGLSAYKTYWGNSEAYDLERTILGVAFLTEKECKADIERRQIESLLLKYGGRRWFDEHCYNYHIGLDDREEHLKAYLLVTVTQGTIYFNSKDNAEKAIEEIGEDRIKKALFEVK